MKKQPFVAFVSDVRSVDFVKPVMVYLDGVEVGWKCHRAVIMSDGSGLAYCWKESPEKGWNGNPERGGPMLNPEKKGILGETLRGKVKIVRPRL